MKFLWSFLIIILFISISCKKDDSSPVAPPLTQPNTVLIPLKVGNSWTYSVKHVTRNGAVIDSGIASMSVVRDSLISNVQWFSLGASSFVTNKNDGYWIKESNGHEFLFYPFPGTVGAVYKIADNLNGILHSSQDTITVPHGKHVCYSYYVSQRPPYGNLSISYMYFQPNIGIIRQEICDNAGFVEYIYSLSGYTVLE